MKQKTNLIVVMGVSGSGKSSVAEAIAKEKKYEFIEADDFHPDENKAHMASGKALTDAMREPWIALLQAHIKQSAKAGRNMVMSFSGLRRLHRSKIRDLPANTLFIHLHGDKELISQRMNERADHFMPSSLLDSQFAALETANKKETIHIIDIKPALEDVITSAIKIAKQEIST